MDVSTSSFKPLNLQEIMMVPLAKQKMEDEFMASSDQVGGLEASTLGADTLQSDKILNEFKDRASSLSQDVINRGVSREQFNKLRKLRGDTQKEFSSGFLGSAIANKKAASTYINKMATDKMAQAGWSPKEAQQWAMHNVSQFQGTSASDGSFNSFNGAQLATKVDEDKFLKEAVDSVAKDIDPKGMRAMQLGGLPAFKQAFQDGVVTKVDFDKVMETIISKSSTNPALLASLKQQAFFTGEKNPLDMGHFNYTDEKVTDAEGNPVYDKDGKQKIRTTRKFEMGDSRYGRKAAGFGNAASYSNLKINTTIVKDEIGFKMWQDGMEEQQAVELISFMGGELNSVNADNIETIESNLKLYGTEVKSLQAQANKRKEKLKSENPKITDAEINSDFEYERLQNLYIDKNTSFKNAESRMKSIYKQVDSQVKPDDKKIFEVQDVLDKYGGDPIKALRGELGLEVSKEYLSGGFNRDEAAKASYILATEMGVDMSGRHRPNHNVWKDTYKGAKDRRTDLTETYLKANPKSESFTRLNGESVGKYYTAIGGWNKTQSENFAVGGSTLAYNGGSLEENEDYQNLLVPGEIPKFRVEMTDGTDDAGNNFNNVIITTSKGSTSVQVIDNENGSARAKIANQLLKGDFAQRRMGTQILADMNHMRNIKKSGMLWQDEGFMTLNLGDGKSRKDVTYTKNPENGFYQVSIGGILIDLNGRTQLSGEKEVSRALAEAVMGINMEKERVAALALKNK